MYISFVPSEVELAHSDRCCMLGHAALPFTDSYYSYVFSFAFALGSCVF